jgi:TRAP-type uncharacterized transport system fused permease subunit
MYCALVHGYLITSTTLSERILLGVGALAMFVQSNAFNIGGLMILTAIVFPHINRKRKRRLKGAPAT